MNMTISSDGGRRDVVVAAAAPAIVVAKNTFRPSRKISLISLLVGEQRYSLFLDPSYDTSFS